MNEIPRKTRTAVIERDRGRCRTCGAIGTEIQHRVRRREGGHLPSNIYVTCSADHRRLHSNPRWAMSKGMTVSAVANINPASVPLWTMQGWVLLHDDYTETVLAPAGVKPDDLEDYLASLLESA